jgi:hypothetical protein
MPFHCCDNVADGGGLGGVTDLAGYSVPMLQSWMKHLSAKVDAVNVELRSIAAMTAWPSNVWRARRNLLKRINPIPPVQSSLEKYSTSRPTQITSHIMAVPSHLRGGSRSSRTRDGMRWTWRCRRRTAPKRTAKPCGPDASTPASSLRRRRRKRRRQESPISGESAP